MRKGNGGDVAGVFVQDDLLGQIAFPVNKNVDFFVIAFYFFIGGNKDGGIVVFPVFVETALEILLVAQVAAVDRADNGRPEFVEHWIGVADAAFFRNYRYLFVIEKQA